jgi:hypothetical protein
MAAYVHAFLLRTAERLWKEARAARPGLRGADRSAFMAGVISGFGEKLDEARREHEGVGLVWAGDPDLRRFFERRHPHVRAGGRTVTSRIDAHALGRSEGKKVVLHRPLEGDARGGTRFLPSDSR